MSHVIYKFLDSANDPIYIGITQNLKGRMGSQHFTAQGHLPAECYEKVVTVLYAKCASETDAKIKERYLINKLSPTFNRMMNKGDVIPWEIEDSQFEWKYIGFDWQPEKFEARSTHLSDMPRTKKSKVVTRSDEALRDLPGTLGEEYRYDLTSAIVNVLPGLICLDGDKVRALGIASYEAKAIGADYLSFDFPKSSNRGPQILSYTARVERRTGSELEQIYNAVDTEQYPYEPQHPDLRALKDCGIDHWIIVPEGTNISEIVFRRYAQHEFDALLLARAIKLLGEGVKTEGWLISENCIGDAINWQFCAAHGCKLPSASKFVDGEFTEESSDIEVPSKKFNVIASCQHRLNAKFGVYVMNVADVNQFIEQARIAIEQLIPVACPDAMAMAA